jgi:hypothetical protein
MMCSARLRGYFFREVRPVRPRPVERPREVRVRELRVGDARRVRPGDVRRVRALCRACRARLLREAALRPSRWSAVRLARERRGDVLRRRPLCPWA